MYKSLFKSKNMYESGLKDKLQINLKCIKIKLNVFDKPTLK